MVFRLIQGSSRPPLELTLQDDEGNAVDLTGATSVKVAVAKNFETEEVDLAIYEDMTVIDAEAGVVRRSWLSSDTKDVAKDTYNAQVEVTFGVDDIAVFGTITFILEGAVRKQP